MADMTRREVVVAAGAAVAAAALGVQPARARATTTVTKPVITIQHPSGGSSAPTVPNRFVAFGTVTKGQDASGNDVFVKDMRADLIRDDTGKVVDSGRCHVVRIPDPTTGDPSDRTFWYVALKGSKLTGTATQVNCKVEVLDMNDSGVIADTQSTDNVPVSGGAFGAGPMVISFPTDGATSTVRVDSSRPLTSRLC
jgi:hypothetical protein